jgi:hypothetical protein
VHAAVARLAERALDDGSVQALMVMSNWIAVNPRSVPPTLKSL